MSQKELVWSDSEWERKLREAEESIQFPVHMAEFTINNSARKTEKEIQDASFRLKLLDGGEVSKVFFLMQPDRVELSGKIIMFELMGVYKIRGFEGRYYAHHDIPTEGGVIDGGTHWRIAGDELIIYGSSDKYGPVLKREELDRLLKLAQKEIDFLKGLSLKYKEMG